MSSDYEEPPASEGDVNLMLDFALETSAHGVGKIARAQNKIRKAMWGLALCGAFIFSIAMISLRCASFIHKHYYDTAIIMIYSHCIFYVLLCRYVMM